MIIALSGPCHSGKTTILQKFSKIENVQVFGQNIRQHPLMIEYGGIQNIRKHPEQYLKLQIQAITDKVINQNRCIFKDILENTDVEKIYVFDRSIFCSLYYYIYYMDKSTLSHKSLNQYHYFLNEWLKHSRKYLYNKILLLSPIPYDYKDDDLYRPKNLGYIQNIEYDLIYSLTVGNLHKVTSVIYTNAQTLNDRIKTFDDLFSYNGERYEDNNI